MDYLRLYNHHIPQSSLGYLTPIQSLKKWQESHPHLFVKSVYNKTTFDSVYPLSFFTILNTTILNTL